MLVFATLKRCSPRLNIDVKAEVYNKNKILKLNIAGLNCNHGKPYQIINMLN